MYCGSFLRSGEKAYGDVGHREGMNVHDLFPDPVVCSGERAPLAATEGVQYFECCSFADRVQPSHVDPRAINTIDKI